jgi:Holliday junction resolvase RusA-like endonuclease
MTIAVFIPCVPPTTTAQQKGAFAMPGGGVRFFKKKKAKQAENTWFALLQPHAPAQPMTGPLTLVVRLTYPWRKTEKKKRTTAFSSYPIETRPDIDNVFKMMADVMTTLGYWQDDSQIAALTLGKYYGDKPGIALTLTPALAFDKAGNVTTP